MVACVVDRSFFPFEDCFLWEWPSLRSSEDSGFIGFTSVSSDGVWSTFFGSIWSTGQFDAKSAGPPDSSRAGDCTLSGSWTCSSSEESLNRRRREHCSFRVLEWVRELTEFCWRISSSDTSASDASFAFIFSDFDLFFGGASDSSCFLESWTGLVLPKMRLAVRAGLDFCFWDSGGEERDESWSTLVGGDEIGRESGTESVNSSIAWTIVMSS